MNRFIKIDIIKPDTGETYRNYEREIDSTIIPADTGIETGSMKLDEILCTGELSYGQYNCNKFEVKLFGINGDDAYALPDMSGSKILVRAETELEYKSLEPYISNDSGYAQLRNGVNPTSLIGNFYIPGTVGGTEVNHISAYGFQNCVNIINLKLPETLTTIGEGAFSGCSGLTGLQFYKNITSIDRNAFSACYNLKTVDYAGAQSQWESIDIDSSNTTLLATRIYYNSTKSTKAIFSGTIESAKKPDNNIYRNIVAYDDMYYVKDINIGFIWTMYWNNFNTEYASRKTVTLKTIREDMCRAVGLKIGNSKNLPNDSKYFCNHNDNLPSGVQVRPIVPRFTDMTFKSLLSAICEIQGCIPNINRLGDIEFIPIPANFGNATNIKLYDNTSTNIDTSKTLLDDYVTSNSLGFNVYATSETLFYKTTENTENPYIVCGNIFLNTISVNEVDSILGAILRLYKSDNNYPTSNYISGKLDLVVSDLDIFLGTRCRLSESSEYCMPVMSISLSGSLLVNEHIESYSYGPTRNPKPSTENDSLIQQLLYKEQRSALTSLQGTVESLAKTAISKDYVEIEVQKLYNNGVSKVVTSGKNYKFDDSGLNVSDPNSPMSTLITENGMQIKKDNLATLDVNYQGVDAKNLKATTFLLVGSNSRMENYGLNRTGCFYVNVNS